jgi:hypothetical protein
VSYSQQGTLKPGVNPEEHALVYTGSDSSSVPPPLLPGELIDKEAIRMESVNGETLHPSSRVNFGKIYTVEHSAKVVELGKIARRHLPRLLAYFQEVRENRRQGTHSDDEDDSNEEDEGEQIRSSPPLLED